MEHPDNNRCPECGRWHVQTKCEECGMVVPCHRDDPDIPGPTGHKPDCPYVTDCLIEELRTLGPDYWDDLYFNIFVAMEREEKGRVN